MKLYQEAEQFINDTFHSESYDKSSSIDLVKRIEERLIADDKLKDPDYYNHRPGVVHVSSLSSCLRGVALSMLGAQKEDIEPRKLGIFKAGNLFEDFITDTLSDIIIEKQREYSYTYKSITLVGRSDYTIDDNGIIRVGENKSVNSRAFWYREKEGILCQWNNQIQLQVYMWLERELNGRECQGIFTYISKDDCTVVSVPIKYNRRIIDEVVFPALELLNTAYEAKDATLVPTPELSIYNPSTGKYKVNWICEYCDYHKQCAGITWPTQAQDEVKRKNKLKID